MPTAHPSSTAAQPSPRQSRRVMHDEDRYAIFPAVHEKSGAKRWQVNLSRGGRLIQMSFPHLKYGGEAAALAVARACRDAVIAAVAPMTHRDMREIKRSNRTDGMPGVYHVAGDARHAAAWAAQILLPDGCSRKRTFPIARYGRARARRLAEAERQRMLDEVEDIEMAALRSPAAVALDNRLAAAATASSTITPRPGITRDACPVSPAWWVKVQAGGLTINRCFPDATFGGETAALAVAHAFQDAVGTFVPPLAASDGEGRRGRRTKAIPGVHFKPAREGRDAYWFVRTVLPDGRVRTRFFAVSRHGADEARRLAEAERLRMLEAENLG